MRKITLIGLFILIIAGCSTTVHITTPVKKQVVQLTAKEVCRTLDKYSGFMLEKSVDFPDMILCTFRHIFMHSEFIGYKDDVIYDYNYKFDVLGRRKLQETTSHKRCNDDSKVICKGTNFYNVVLLRKTLIPITKKSISKNVIENSSTYFRAKIKVILPSITEAFIKETVVLANAIYRSNKSDLGKPNSCSLTKKLLTSYKKKMVSVLAPDVSNDLLRMIEYDNYVYIKDVLYFNSSLYNYMQALYGCIQDKKEASIYLKNGEKILARIFQFAP